MKSLKNEAQFKVKRRKVPVGYFEMKKLQNRKRLDELKSIEELFMKTSKKRNLREAMVVGPTGSFKHSVAGSQRVMGYRGLTEDDDSYDDDYYGEEFDQETESGDFGMSSVSFNILGDYDEDDKAQIADAINRALHYLGVVVEEDITIDGVGFYVDPDIED